eukprot:COSAG02_NODE_5727_length_4089_cov_2.288471_8_plen_86_part_00
MLLMTSLMSLRYASVLDSLIWQVQSFDLRSLPVIQLLQSMLYTCLIVRLSAVAGIILIQDDLAETGMKPLEVKRFMRAHQELMTV